MNAGALEFRDLLNTVHIGGRGGTESRNSWATTWAARTACDGVESSTTTALRRNAARVSRTSVADTARSSSARVGTRRLMAW